MHRTNAINWFEIPVTDLTRAQRFYEAVLATNLRQETMNDHVFAVFPYEEPGVGGCLLSADGSQPSAQGCVVYLDAGPRIDDVLQRVENAGGKITLPKTALPEGMGFFAHIVDCEGNRVGLHALQ